MKVALFRDTLTLGKLLLVTLNVAVLGNPPGQRGNSGAYYSSELLLLDVLEQT